MHETLSEHPPAAIAGDRPLQVFQTTISQPGTPVAQFMTIPARSLAIPELVTAPEEVFKELGLEILDGFYLSELPTALWTALASGRPMPDGPREEWADQDRATMSLCEYIVFFPSVPFEFSDQRSAGLAVVAAGAAAGGKVGFLIGTPGGPPLIAVATAGGVVIGGLVGTVTWVLSEGLAERLSGLFHRH